jgi:hypothetical protein
VIRFVLFALDLFCLKGDSYSVWPIILRAHDLLIPYAKFLT